MTGALRLAAATGESVPGPERCTSYTPVGIQIKLMIRNGCARRTGRGLRAGPGG